MSNFHCCCGSTDHDPPEIFSESFPIARKEHLCVECHEKILPGQKYHYVKGKWEFGWDTYKTCHLCYLIREDYCECGYIFGELSEALWDCLGFDYRTNEGWDDEEENFNLIHGESPNVPS